MFCTDYRRGKIMDMRSVWQCWPPVDFNFLTFEFQFPIFPLGTLVYNDFWEFQKLKSLSLFFWQLSRFSGISWVILCFAWCFMTDAHDFSQYSDFHLKKNDTNSEIDHFQKNTVPPMITLVQQSSPKRPGVNNCNFTWYFSIYHRWEQKWRQN